MSLSGLYGMIVFKCKIDPRYFLDEMTPHEVNALMEAYMDEYKDGWEKIRYTNHAIISSQSSKSVKLTDIMPFPWDKEDIKGRKEMSKDRLETLKKKAEQTKTETKDGKGI